MGREFVGLERTLVVLVFRGFVNYFFFLGKYRVRWYLLVAFELF